MLGLENILNNYTQINPILKLFASKNIPLSLIVIIVILGLFLGMMMVHVSNRIYLKRFVKYKNFYTFLKEYFKTVFLLFIPLCFACFVFIFYFDITNKNINKTPLKTVFSSYYIASIEQPEETGSTIVYDTSGNQKSEKPKTIFKVYLNKIEYSHVETMSLKDNVVLKVSKVNEDSFEIILPDEKVEKIKKDDAPEVFNALKKIKDDDDNWMKINKMLRDRKVEKEE